MPKVVDHAQRRDEIALVACQAIARRGFAQATVAHIARTAGYTTGMVAHYFESKQQIILAALRLILRRIELRLTQRAGSADTDLLGVLCEALPIDAQRRTECAFWIAFWGQLPADPELKRLNAWVHREYRRLFERCLREHWPESGQWPVAVARGCFQIDHHVCQWHHGQCRVESEGLASQRAGRTTADASGEAPGVGACRDRYG